jgi:predicted ester cyclase
MDARYVDVIRAAAARLNASDVEGYLANFQPDCLHWIAGSPDAMPMPAFIESLHGMRAGLPDMHLEELALFGVDNFVSAHWRTSGTHSAELFGMAPTQRAVSFDTAEVYEFDDTGQVRTSWAFGDPGELFRQLSDNPNAGPA